MCAMMVVVLDETRLWAIYTYCVDDLACDGELQAFTRFIRLVYSSHSLHNIKSAFMYCRCYFKSRIAVILCNIWFIAKFLFRWFGK